MCRKHIKNPTGSFPIILGNDKQEQLLLSCGSIKLQQSNFVPIVDNINQTYVANCVFFFTVWRWWMKHETELIP